MRAVSNVKIMKTTNRNIVMSIASQASEAAQLPKLMLYGGGAFSVGQWVAQNVNTIAAVIGVVVTIAGFVWSRMDASKKRKEEREEHEAKMQLLAAELEKVRQS